MERFPEYFRDCFTNDLRMLDLLSMRNDPSLISRSFASSISENQIFISLPTFTKEIISKVTSEYKSKHELRLALQKYNISNDFSQQKFIEALTLVQEDCSEINNFIFLYEVFLWFGQSDDKITLILFRKILEVFASFTEARLSQLNHIVFMSFSVFGLTTPLFELTNVEISIIIKYLIINENIPPDFFPLLMLLTDYAANREDQIYRSIINSINTIFEEKRPIIQPESVHILSHILVNKINQLDPVAILLTCNCAKYSEKSTLMDIFLLLPSHILNSLAEGKHFIDAKDFTSPREIKNDLLTVDEMHVMTMPNQSTIENGLNYSEIVSWNISELIQLIQPVIGDVKPAIATQFLSSIQAIGNITKNLPQKIDFALIIAPLIQELSNHNDITAVKECLFDEIIFNPNVTLFHENPPKYLNFVRNTMLKACCKDKSLLSDVLVSFNIHPFLFSELILRLLYLPSLDDQFVFHVNPDNVINALIQVTLTFPGTEINRRQTAVARSICLTYLFDLFAVPENAARCFESERFMSCFSVLMEERNLCNVILKSFESALTGLKVLPSPIVISISCILVKCSMISDEFYKDLGARLSKVVVGSMLINQGIRDSIPELMSPLIEMLGKIPDQDSLKILLDLLFSTAQYYERLIYDNGMFIKIINIIKSVEGEDPSDSTLLRLYNVLSNSSTVGLGQLFVIKVPTVIPLILAASYKSKNYSDILDFFTQLCSYSSNNAYAMHYGDMTSILLQQLKGKFSYNNFVFDKVFDDVKLITDHFFPLISAILETKSSCSVDQHLFNLFMPDENNNFPPLSIPVLKMVNSVITANESQPTTQFEITSPEPVIENVIVPHEKMNQNWMVKMKVKIDTKIHSNSNFVLFSFEDQSSVPCKLTIYTLADTIVARYIRYNIRSTATIMKKIPDNQWINVTLFNVKTPTGQHMISFLERDFKEETEYNNFEFTSPVKLSIAKTEDLTIDKKYMSPVILGTFQFLSYDQQPDEMSVFIDQNYEQLSKNPLNFLNCDNILHLRKKVKNGESLFWTIPIHICLSDFIPVFDIIKNAPPNYAELLIPIILRGRNINISSTKRILNINSNWDIEKTNNYLKNLTGLDFDYLPKENCLVNSNKSDISGLVFTIARNLNTSQLNHHLFNSITSILESIESDDYRREIIEDVIYNLFIWSDCDDFSQKKITLFYVNKSEALATPNLFNLFLHRSYLLLFKSKKTFNSLMTSFIKILELISRVYMTENDLSDLIKIMELLDDPANYKTYGQLLETLIYKGYKVKIEDAMRFRKLAEKSSYDDLIWLIGILQVGCQEYSKFILYHLFTVYLQKNEMIEMPLNNDMYCIKLLFKGDHNIVFERFGNLIVSMEEFWFFWPLMIGFWFKEKSDIIVNFIVPPLLNAKPVDLYMKQICILFDIVESLNLFEISNLKRKLFLRICNELKVMKQEDKTDIANALIVAYVQEFLFGFTDNSYNKEFLNFLKSDNSSIVTGQETFDDFIKEKLPPINDRNFHFDEFKERINSDFSRFYYRKRCIKGDEEFFEITKKVSEFASQYASGSEFVNNAVRYVQTFTEKIPEPRTNIFDFMLSANYYFGNYKSELMKLRDQIVFLLTPPPVIDDDSSNSCFALISQQVKSLRDKFHSSLVFSDNRSMNITRSKYNLPFISKQIPLSLDAVQPKNAPQLYNSLFSNDEKQITKFSEIKEQFKCPASVLVLNERIPVQFELWYSKLLLRQEQNIPLTVDFAKLKFAVANNNQIIFYSFNCSSLLIEFSQDDFTKTVSQLVRLSVPIADRKSQIEALQNKWKEGLLSNFELLLHTNIIFGKTFDDFRNYIEMPAILIENESIMFGKYQNIQTSDESKINLIKNVQESKEINIPEEIKKQYSQTRSVQVEFYISSDLFARKSNVIVPKMIKSPVNFTYMYRMWLELPGMTEKILNFIHQKFGVTFSSEVKKITNTQRMESKLTIADNTKFRMFLSSDDQFIAITQGSLFYIFFFEMNNLILLKSYTNQDMCKSAVLYIDGTATVCTPQNKIFTLSIKNSKSEVIDCQITHLSQSHKRVVFACSNGAVYISNSSEFPNIKKLIFVSASEITHLVTSDEYDVCVIAEKSGIITVVCLSDSYIYGKFDTEGKTINSIVVTPSSGFVVVSLHQEFIVLSLCLTLLSSSPYKGRVSQMVAVRTCHGADYVYFSDNRFVYVFEAMFPSNIVSVYESRKKIMGIAYCKSIASIICASLDNKLVTIPVSIGR